MSTRVLFTACLGLLAAASRISAVPVEIARESFEGAPAAIGFVTSVPQFDEPSVATSDFFTVMPNNGTRTSGGTIAGGDGASMIAAEDLDTAPALLGPTQSITFNPVNIAGKSSVSVRLLLAAPGTGPAAGGSQNFYDWSATASDIDFVRVEASVDAGPFNRLIQFSPVTASLNQALGVDSDGNGLADAGTGNLLTAAFREFDLPVSNGGSLQIRVVMHSNATSEYLCVDNVRVFADTPATAPPALGNVPEAPLNFIEGSPAQAVAPAMTVTDADSASLTSATVSIVSGYVIGEDVLTSTPGGNIAAGDIVFNPGTGILTITRSATPANYQAVLRSVAYRNTNITAPGTATRQIQFRISDGVNPGNQPIRQVDVVDTVATRTIPFTESFETDGHGTRYSLDGKFTGAAAFFDRISPAGLSNTDGVFVVAGVDTELNPATVEAVRFLIDASSFSHLLCSVRLGAPGGTVYDSGDLIAIESRTAGGGPWTTVAEFRSTSGASGSMALDTDVDGTGDGAALSGVLQQFDFPLAAAPLQELRIRMVSNTAGELLVADRVRVTGFTGGPFIPLTGTLSHSENFDTLPLADTPWTDSALRQGWYAQINNGTTPAGLLHASDGSAPLTGLINCGATGATDRALGSKATSTGGFANIASAAVFKNVSELPVKLARLRYVEELWRTGTAATEKVTAFYAISSAPLSSIQSGTTSATAAAGSGFLAMPAGANAEVTAPAPDTALDGNLAANRSAVDHTFAPATEPVVQPGQFLTIKWTDTNEAGTDGHQAIDDVIADFVQLDCSISPVVLSVTRKPGASQADAADDTVDVSLDVQGIGSTSGTGWKITAGVLAGMQSAYGGVLLTDIPVSAFTPSLTIVFEDSVNPVCQGSAIINLPAALGITGVNGPPSYIQASGAPAVFRQTGTTELTMDPGSAVLLTDAFTVTAGTEKCLTLILEAQDTSAGSGFEAADNVRVELLTNSPRAPVTPLTRDLDLNSDGVISGGATPETDEFNTESQAAAIRWTTSFTLMGIIPANATSFQIRITAVIDNTGVPSTEILRFRDITLVPCVDTDKDGVSDTLEAIHGTGPGDAASRFRIVSVITSGGATLTQFSTVPGRVYQPLVSSDLGLWSRDGIPQAGSGADQSHTVQQSGVRLFQRLLVLPPQSIQP